MAAKPRTDDSRAARHRRTQHEQLLAAITIVAAVVAGFAPGEPTGLPVWDIVLKCVLAAAFVLAVAQGPDWSAIVVTTVTVALVGRSVWLAVAAVGLIVAVVAAVAPADDHRVRPVLFRAIAAAAAVQGLLRLPSFGPFGAPSAAAGATIILALVLGYRSSDGAQQRAIRRAMIAGTIVAAAVVAVGGFVLLSARSDVERGVAAARDGLSAARGGDPEAVVASLEEAADALTVAERRVDSIWTQPLRLVPVAAQHQQAITVATERGSAIARQASRTTIEADISSIRMTAGSVDLAALAAMETDLVNTVELVESGIAELADVGSPWLVPPVASRLESLTDELRTVLPEARVAADAAKVVPAMLGNDAPRRYLVLFGSPAESRELGGFVGSWALLEFDSGAISQIDAGRTADLYELTRSNAPLGPLGYPEWYVQRAIPEYWPQNLTSSPQLSIVTAAARELLDGLGGAPVDGLVYLDSYALGAFFNLTGPIQIDGLDQRLTPANATDFFLDGQYRIDDRNEVKDDLTEIFAAAFDGLLDTRLPGPEQLGRVLGPVARQGRLQVMTFDDTENEFLRSIKLQRTFGPPIDSTDAFALVQANGSASKLDLYLDRDVSYRVALEESGALEVGVTVTLTSDVPEDAPAYALGNTVAGQNVSYLSFYSPHELVSVSVDGAETPAMRTQEFGFNRYEIRVELPANETRTIEYELAGEVDPERPYSVSVWHQPLVNNDRVQIDYESPAGPQSESFDLIEDITVAFRD